MFEGDGGQSQPQVNDGYVGTIVGGGGSHLGAIDWYRQIRLVTHVANLTIYKLEVHYT